MSGRSFKSHNVIHDSLDNEEDFNKQTTRTIHALGNFPQPIAEEAHEDDAVLIDLNAPVTLFESA